MAKALDIKSVAARISEAVPDSVTEAAPGYLGIKPEAVLQVARFLKDTSGLELDYLNCLTATDYLDYMEVVYIMSSIEHCHELMMKVRCSRENPEVPSVISVWRGADFQEREVYDLLGITFSGHPNMKRLFMWEGFEGHPLRRDYV